ncbi:MAG: hypothetical protein H6721_10535 [Sandaracinus sp.]|nr:hypothetical protein [Sandaracinus sp.]MCB9632555.1 hypothetical protein [Sandaracinus sp.]
MTWTRALWLAFGVLGVGCGAKTGLYTPDADLDAGVDGGLDAGTDAGIPCIEVPRDAGIVEVDFELPVRLAVVDVMFVIDATASMIDEIDNVRRRLRDVVVPGVRAIIPDAAFGVAFVGEFPVDPHGPSSVLPYEMRSPITTDTLVVESSLEDPPSWGNFDEPEAQVEGLYQIVTGEGLGPWIPPSAGCATGGSGAACFRREALPIVLVITDAPMNNGPPGVRPESRYRFTRPATPHTYDEALAALRSIDALTIGLGARDSFAMSPMNHLRQLARDTGAVDGSGPLAFDIGGSGEGVGRGVVDAIQRLAAGTPLDVDAIVEDVPGDRFDATLLVRRVIARSATPADGVREISGATFFGTLPGTQVRFAIELDPSAFPDTTETLVIPARVSFRAFERARLGREDVVFVIPGSGGGCDDVVLP